MRRQWKWQQRCTHIRIILQYSHTFSSSSSKFHSWCAEMGT